MIPTGGFSVFIHLVINVLAYVVKVFSRTAKISRLLIVPAPLIAVVLTGTIMYFAGTLFVQALNSENNLDHIAFALHRCPQEQSITSTERTIIVRIDDIQAFAWTDISMQLISDATAHDIPVSLAIIPLGLRDDASFYTFLRQQRCNVEFALHGWDNREPAPGVGEFATLSEREAAKRLQKGIAVIDRLAREKVVTFVLPLNELSPGAHSALSEEDIAIVSSAGDGRFDFDTTTFDFISDTHVSAGEVASTCARTFAAGDDICVIMVHPQDFATDGTLDMRKYQTYRDLLVELQARGYTFARFKDFVR